MISLEETARQRRPRPSRRQRVARAVLLVAGLVLVFLLGVAFAETLDDRPTSGATVTDVRTLTPVPQEGPVRTVTVTVTTTP